MIPASLNFPAWLFGHHFGGRLGYQLVKRSLPCVRSFSVFGLATMILADNLAIVRCASCGGMMKLVRTVPRPEGLPPLIVMSCTSCNEVDVKEEDRRVA